MGTPADPAHDRGEALGPAHPARPADRVDRGVRDLRRGRPPRACGHRRARRPVRRAAGADHRRGQRDRAGDGVRVRGGGRAADRRRPGRGGRGPHRRTGPADRRARGLGGDGGRLRRTGHGEARRAGAPRVRRAGRAGQQRRHRPVRLLLRHDDRGLAHRPRRQPLGRDPRLPALRGADGRARTGRPHRQHRVGGRLPAVADPARLQHLQGGGPDAVGVPARGTRLAVHRRDGDLPRHRQHRHHLHRPLRRCRRGGGVPPPQEFGPPVRPAQLPAGEGGFRRPGRDRGQQAAGPGDPGVPGGARLVAGAAGGAATAGAGGAEGVRRVVAGSPPWSRLPTTTVLSGPVVHSFVNSPVDNPGCLWTKPPRGKQPA
ncbi:hypothetical protein SGPA1_50196 [Streptomyces misionensis JCM 4497]